MRTSVFILLHLAFVCFQSAIAYNWVDCSYDKDTEHVEYICDSGNQVFPFSQRNREFLFCNNYEHGIDRKLVRVLSFRGCHDSSLSKIVSYFNLRTYNISHITLQILDSTLLQTHKYLEHFIVSNNELSELPADLFKFSSGIIEIDFSHNKIRAIDPFIFDNTHKLKTIRFAHNRIAALHSRLFSNLPNLEFIDFSDNRIEMIEHNLFDYNKKLKSANFINNQIKRLDCKFLPTVMDVRSLNISLNTLDELQTDCANESMHIKLNVTISTNETAATTLKIADGKFEWIFTGTDFVKLRKLNFSNSHTKDIPSLLEGASAELITLDLSKTFVGALNEKTFQKFTNLQYLNLSRTNLSNFQFATFYHQTNLRDLDLSYNGLNSVDFHLFERTFQHLESLNLEGNNLTEISTLQWSRFRKLSTLAISKNRFTCEYLAQFLSLWPKLKIIHNPSTGMVHMGSVDCIHENRNAGKTNNNNLPMAFVGNPENKPNHLETQSENHLKELYAIKLLLMVLTGMTSIVCLFFAIDKCKRFAKFCDHWKRTELAADSVLFSNHETQCRKCNKKENIYANDHGV